MVKSWRKSSQNSWFFVKPLGAKQTIRIKKESDKFNKFNYRVYWGTENPKQFKRFTKTKAEALAVVSKLKRNF